MKSFFWKSFHFKSFNCFKLKKFYRLQGKHSILYHFAYIWTFWVLEPLENFPYHSSLVLQQLIIFFGINNQFMLSLDIFILMWTVYLNWPGRNSNVDHWISSRECYRYTKVDCWHWLQIFRRTNIHPLACAGVPFFSTRPKAAPYFVC